MNKLLGTRFFLAAVIALPLGLGANLPPAVAQKKIAPIEPPPKEAPEWMIRVSDIVFAKNVTNGGASPLARSKSRLDWAWLAREHGLPVNGKLNRENFRGPKELFDRLDRDGDRVLHAGDFDWSEEAPFVRQQALASALFNRLNQGGDGTISAKEWQEAFTRMAGRKGELTQEDIRKMLYPARTVSMSPPSRWHRLFGFFSGELGSFNEGPNPGEDAPDFLLKTPEGKTEVKLSAYWGKKPLVLIFGNFT
jgi:Ca2+-binding EF-hand superfamily protein